MSRISSDFARPTKTGFLLQYTLNRNVREFLSSLVQSKQTGILLDVGCGNSPYGKLLQNWRRVAMNIDANDANPEIIGDGLCIPIRDSSVDAVLCTQVIEHVRDPFVLVEEFARITRPGGSIILSAPMHWPLHEEPYDYWRFTEHGFRELIRRANLELVEIRPQGGAISVAAIAMNHVFRGPLFLPLRLGMNLSAYVLDRLIRLPYSTSNYTLVARKPL